MKELVPVALLSSTPHALVVAADSPIRTVAQLIDAAKKRDGLVYASGGAGSTTHLAVELFGSMAGIKLEHVPYKGSTAAHVDVATGRVDFMMDIISSVTPLIKAGKLRLVAVTTDKRMLQFPDVPTVAETAGLSKFEAISWTGLFAPAKTPSGIVKKLSDALTEKTDEAAFRTKVEANGAYYTPMGSTDFASFVRADYDRWQPVLGRATK
jgi:tripartite-type tricarboxylate transporter receptor subunit TctC